MRCSSRRELRSFALVPRLPTSVPTRNAGSALCGPNASIISSWSVSVISITWSLRSSPIILRSDLIRASAMCRYPTPSVLRTNLQSSSSRRARSDAASGLVDSSGISAPGDRQGIANERVVRGRPSQPPRPRVMSRRSQGRRRSVYGGTRVSAIELRNQALRGADAVSVRGRPHRKRRHRRAAREPRAVKDPAHAWQFLAREPGDPNVIQRRWVGGSVGEGHTPYARHARRWEVGWRHSTAEVAEQRPEARGGDGGKAANKGELGANGHVPDSERDQCVARLATSARGCSEGQEGAVHHPTASPRRSLTDPELLRP